MKVGKIILIVSGIAVAAVLYFAPFAPTVKKKELSKETESGTEGYDMTNDLAMAKSDLDSVASAGIATLEAALTDDGAAGNETVFDSLIASFDRLRKPLGSSFYAAKKAELLNTADAWKDAGDRYLLNAKYMQDKANAKNWFSESRKCYEKAVKTDEENLDMKVDLAVCLIESSSFLGTPPMEGIGMLKNVEQADPKNVKALTYLGYFASKSGQFEKAEQRFKKVLEINKDDIEVYLYLADMHEKQEQFELAIADLKKYRSRSENPSRIQEIDKYIEELKKKI